MHERNIKKKSCPLMYANETSKILCIIHTLRNIKYTYIPLCCKINK